MRGWHSQNPSRHRIRRGEKTQYFIPFFAVGDNKQYYGWPEEAQFLVPTGVYDHFTAGVGVRGAEARRQWTERFAAYCAQYPDCATEIALMQRRELPAGWDRNLPVFPADPKGMAGRDA